MFVGNGYIGEDLQFYDHNWAEPDLNRRKLLLADLQSASFNHSDIDPFCLFPRHSLRPTVVVGPRQ
jgi:hypothetical protein